MRYLSMLIIFIAGSTIINAQTPTGTNNSGQRKTQTKKASVRQQKGRGLYHGSRDTTPGSPMGTGGAGGDMSGSPAGSAIETNDQTDKAEVQKDTTTTNDTSGIKKTTAKKRSTTRRKARSNN